MQSTAGTAADVLGNLPSVEVTPEGQVSLRGDPHVAVLINGRPANLSAGDGLLQLPAAEIERVEVITSPPADLAANGVGGVVNIVIKQRLKQSGSIRIAGGNEGRYAADLAGSRDRGRLHLSGGANVRGDYRLRLVAQYRRAPDAAGGIVVRDDHDLREDVRRLTPSARLSAVYDISPDSSLALNASYGERRGERYFLQQDVVATPSGAQSSGLRQSFGHEWRLDAQEGLRYALDRDGRSLTVEVQRSELRERERYRYLNVFLLPAAADTRDTLRLSLDLVKTTAAIDLVRPLADGLVLKVGYWGERDRNAYDNSGQAQDLASGALVANPAVTDDFRYAQTIAAGYASLNREWDGKTLAAGVRVERTDVRALAITTGQPLSDRYTHAYPSFQFGAELTPSLKVSASFSERVSRPDPEQLNPFTDRQDTRSLRAGNPRLRPEETKAYEISLVHTAGRGSAQATFYYRDIRNAVTDVVTILPDGATLSSKQNLPAGRDGGIELSGEGRIWRGLSYRASTNVYYSEIEPTGLAAARARSDVSGNARLRLDDKLGPAGALQLGLNYTGARLTPQGETSPSFALNLGYRRELGRGVQLGVAVADALDTQRQRRQVETGAFSETTERRVRGPIVLVSLTRAFGRATPERQPGPDDEQ